MRVGQRAKAGKWAILVMLCWIPLFMCAACSDDPVGDQVRTDIAPAVSSLLGAFGDLAGAWSAAVIRPVAEEPPAESSLQ